MSRPLIPAGLIVATLLTSSQALAQPSPAPPTAREACRSSAFALCADEVKLRDRAAVRACLIRNFAKAAPECQAAMKAQAAKESQKPADAPPRP